MTSVNPVNPVKTTKVIKKIKLAVCTETVDVPFMEDISQEDQHLFALKYLVYITANAEKFAYNTVDHKYRKKNFTQICKDSCENKSGDADQNALKAILHTLESLYVLHTNASEQEHMIIEIHCTNVYAVNVVREWMIKWIQNNMIQDRPNAEILLKIHSIMSKHSKNISLHHTVMNDYFPVV